MPNKPDTLLPAASQVASAVLNSLTYHRHVAPDDLRQRGDWLHGAKLLATALNDQAAADLLQAIGTRLTAIAASPGTDADLRAEIAALVAPLPGGKP